MKKPPPPPLNLPEIPSHVNFPTLSQKGMESPSLKKVDEFLDRTGRKRPSDGMTKTNALSNGPSAFPEKKMQQYSAMADGTEGKDRIASALSTKSAQSGSSSVYSKSTGTSLGGLSKTMETLLEDIAKEVGPSSALGSTLTPGPGLTKSKSASALASPTNSMGGSKAQRSHTVSSPDSVLHKKPGRTATGSSFRTDSNSSRVRETSDNQSVRSSSDRGLGSERRAAEKTRICVRCETPLVDKRWVQMDGGTVLCEKCWKYMYLPKVRPICSLRLPIALLTPFISVGDVIYP